MDSAAITPDIDVSALTASPAGTAAIIAALQQQGLVVMPGPPTQSPVPSSTPRSAQPSKKRGRSSKTPADDTSSVDTATRLAGKESASWTHLQIETFLDKLVEIAQDGGASDGGFKESALTLAGKAIEDACGVSYTTTQLRTKWDWLKARWQTITYLHGRSGIQFDDILQQFNATDEVWDALIAENKLVRNRPISSFRSVPIDHYESLSSLFNTISCGATGSQAETAEDQLQKVQGRVPAQAQDPKKERRLTSAEAIVQLAKVLSDPERSIMAEVEDILDEWAAKPDAERHGITIETLDAMSEDFGDNISLARRFVCKKEKAQLRMLSKKQMEMIAAGEQQPTRRRRRSSSPLKLI